MRGPVLSIFKVLDAGVGPHYFPLQSGYLGSTTDYDKAAQLVFTRQTDQSISRWRVKVNTAPGVGESYTFQLHYLSNWQTGPDRSATVQATITISGTDTEGSSDVIHFPGEILSYWFCSVTRSAGAPVAQGKSSMVIETDGAYQSMLGQNFEINVAPTAAFQVLGNTMGVGESGPNLYRRKFFPLGGTLVFEPALQDPSPAVREFATLRLYKNGALISTTTGDVGWIRKSYFTAVPGDWFVMDGKLSVGAGVRVNPILSFYPDVADAIFLSSNIGGVGAVSFSSTPIYISPAGDISYSATEADVSVIAPIGMVLSVLLLALPSGPGGAVTVTATLRVNGVDTALAVSLTGFQQFNKNSATAVLVQPGDLLSIKLSTDGPTYSNSTFICTSVQTVAAVEFTGTYDVESSLFGQESSSYQVGSFLAPPPADGKFSPYDMGSHLASVETYAVGSHLADEPQIAYNVQSRLQARLGDGEGWAAPWHLFDRA